MFCSRKLISALFCCWCLWSMSGGSRARPLSKYAEWFGRELVSALTYLLMLRMLILWVTMTLLILPLHETIMLLARGWDLTSGSQHEHGTFVRPDPGFRHISCVTTLHASLQSWIHPIKETLMSNKTLRVFIASPKLLVILFLPRVLSIIKLNFMSLRRSW